MDYHIEEKNTEAIRVAYISYEGLATDANRLFPKVFKSIKGNASGAPFVCYRYIDPITKIGSFDICIPTEQTPMDSTVFIKEMPAIRAICTTHTGAYESLSSAYRALNDYSKENNLQLLSPYKEIYIKGPGMLLKGDPTKYITEIIVPVKGVTNVSN